VPTFSKIRGPAARVDAILANCTPLSAAGDVRQALQRTDLAERSAQLTGTFAASTIGLVRSNDGTNYVTCSLPPGAALPLTPAGLMQVSQPTAWVRPRVTVGSGASLTVTLTARRTLR